MRKTAWILAGVCVLACSKGGENPSTSAAGGTSSAVGAGGAGSGAVAGSAAAGSAGSTGGSGTGGVGASGGASSGTGAAAGTGASAGTSAGGTAGSGSDGGTGTGGSPDGGPPLGDGRGPACPGAPSCLDQWQTVSGGEAHACAIHAGALYCWGDGELGATGPAERAVHRVGTTSSYSALAAGHGTALLEGGKLSYMGSNYYGVLGPADTVSHPLPEPIGAHTDWIAISNMDHFLNDTACGVRGGGLYCWGGQQSGVLGDPALAEDACNDGQRNCKYGPGRVGSDGDWSDVSVGFGFACGVRAGNLYCWGSDTDGKVGDGSPITPLCADFPTCPRFSTPIGPSGGFQLVSAGYTFACAIRSGELYCWGSDRYGQVGDGPGSDAICAQGCRWAPTRIGTDGDWDRVSAGNQHACGIRRGGLFCWGMNEYGQLGDGTLENRDAPTRIGVHADWYDVSASKDFTCAVRQGELYCWGFNFSGELGDGGPDSEECTRGYPCHRLPTKVVRP